MNGIYRQGSGKDMIPQTHAEKIQQEILFLVMISFNQKQEFIKQEKKIP